MASGLSVTVFFATVLCCSFSGVAQASGTLANIEKPLPACHAQSGKTNVPAQEGDCCKPQLQAEQSARTILSATQIVTDLIPVEFLPQQIFALKGKFNLAYLDGPPGPVSETPLYITVHNFRL